MLTITDPVDVANGLRPALHLGRRPGRSSRLSGSPAVRRRSSGRSDQARNRCPRAGRAEGVSPPAMTAYVDRLESAGLVARRRSDRDRRRVELALTDEGVRVLRSARSRRTAWLAARLQRLEPEELGAVEAALPALRKLIEDGS